MLSTEEVSVAFSRADTHCNMEVQKVSDLAHLDGDIFVIVPGKRPGRVLQLEDDARTERQK
jgi:hypothetical protein